MRPMAEWKGDVPSLDVLNRMVAGELPLGLGPGPVELSFHRDAYFDSADWTLRRRGVTCRFRVRLHDRPIPTLRTIGRAEARVPLTVPETAEAEVPELEGAQALAGASEPARRLRALIEPGRLVPRIQFETERRGRPPRPRWWRRARDELAYAAVAGPRPPVARTVRGSKVRPR